MLPSVQCGSGFSDELDIGMTQGTIHSTALNQKDKLLNHLHEFHWHYLQPL